ncbi:MAG TPA: prepilin-type N-terminal cleavage/methylation domain-containing protein [Armatimonadota bacterium]|nr:prepilin-type N-terminal cleavage/methylation domain-containing protein [Armatimonadota bacterium]
MLRKQRTTGFTIIELLVVVAIIAILAAIGFPVYKNLARNVRYNSCMDNMREIGVALTLYHNDYGKYPAAPRPDYLTTMDVNTMPYSDLTWGITGSNGSDSVKVDSVAFLATNIPMKLIPTTEWKTTDVSADMKTVTVVNGADLKANMSVAVYDATTHEHQEMTIESVSGNSITFTAALPSDFTGHYLAIRTALSPEYATIKSVDTANHIVTFTADLSRSYANGGVLELVPLGFSAKADKGSKSVTLESTDGLVAGMRVLLRDQHGDIYDEPLIDSISGNTVNFYTALTHSYTLGSKLEWDSDDFGLATLYFLYTRDKRDYVRDYATYHCPEIRDTEKVDRSAKVREAGSDQQSFDPLWSGYNTYDLTYNYDQYTNEIANFDQAINDTDFNNVNNARQLSNPTPPANTVVCWCYGHGGNYSPAVKAQPEYAASGIANVETVERQRSKAVSLVLWVDGTVRPVSPYVMKGKDGSYYWVPPYLYSPGDVR